MPYVKQGTGERCRCNGYLITRQHLKTKVHLEYEEMCKWIQHEFESSFSQGDKSKPASKCNESVPISRSCA